jgi:hypothetical protein
MWVQHDGTLAHSSGDIMRYFDSHFPGQWIGRNGPFVWPPRSPDLTPVYFYLWGHLKPIIYARRCNSRNELWNAIETAETTMHNMPDVFQRTWNSWCNRAQLCSDCNCMHFKHLLLIVSNWPDVFLFTVNKVFNPHLRYCLFFFASASCCHISLTKWLRPYIRIWLFLFACECIARCLYIFEVCKYDTCRSL